jgi:aryl-alcohol dehydrogenase-like predicted oxidoreductase
MHVEITQLGRAGLKVSRLCLGTMNFGPRTSEQDAQEIMARAARPNRMRGDGESSRAR